MLFFTHLFHTISSVYQRNNNIIIKLKYVYMYVCMHVCMYACMYVCIYVMLLFLDVLHLGHQTFRRSSVTPGRKRKLFLEIHPIITFSMNNQITHRSYYVELFTTLCEKLCTIICNAKNLLYYCSKLRNPLLDTTKTASTVTISRVGFHEAINMLTGSTKYQDGYFCDKMYPGI